MKKAGFIEFWKQKARELELQAYALYFAFRDPRTPWYARAVTGLVVAYAFSPIDLIPDFIPLLGYLDDLLVVPLGVALALKLVPAQVMEDSRQKARDRLGAQKPAFKFMGAVIIGVWIVVAAGLAWLVLRNFV